MNRWYLVYAWGASAGIGTAWAIDMRWCAMVVIGTLLLVGGIFWTRGMRREYDEFRAPKPESPRKEGE